MKKFLACVFILAVFSGVVFYFGWTQFRVKPDTIGIVVSKTHGIDDKPVLNGKFSWHWQFLLPTNAELRTFEIKPVNVTKEVSGCLPSGEAYASIYGNTKKAAEILADILRNKGEKVEISDLAREDWAEAVENAFRYDKMVVASPTYDGEIFPVVEAFLNHIKAKNYQNRTVAFIENGSWAPMAAKKMRANLENCKNLTFIDPVVSIISAVKEADKVAIGNLAISLVG